MSILCHSSLKTKQKKEKKPTNINALQTTKPLNFEMFLDARTEKIFPFSLILHRSQLL